MLTQTGFRFAAFLYRWSLSDINDNTVQGNVPVRVKCYTNVVTVVANKI